MENISAVYEPKKKNVYNKMHGIFALLALILGSLHFNWVMGANTVFEGAENTYGLSVVLFAAVFLVFVFMYFKMQKKKFNRETVFFAAITFVCSLRFLIFKDGDAVSVIAMFVMHATALLCIFSMNETEKPTENIVPCAAKAVFVMPFASFFALPISFSAFFKKRDKAKESGKYVENVMLVIIGVIIALPVVLVVLSLLISDVFFENFADGVFDFFSSLEFIDISEYINPVTILISLFIYGAIYSADKSKNKKMKADVRLVPDIVSNTVMIVLTAIYGLFIVSQIEGYGCMIFGKIPENTTYAEFARSGFFELCTVACINGAIIYGANAVSETGGTGRKMAVLAVILAAVTLFLIATAGAKMIIYITAYGFTPKRFYTLWFMVLLAIIFSLSLVKLKNRRFKLSPVCVYITAAMLILLFFIDFECVATILNLKFGF